MLLTNSSAPAFLGKVVQRVVHCTAVYSGQGFFVLPTLRCYFSVDLFLAFDYAS